MPALEQMKQMLLPLRLYILSPESRVYAELCAYAQGLEAAQQRLDQLMEAAFIQTAPADRLAVWERILGLPAQSEGPLERRAAILARLSLGPPGFTRAETESLLEQVFPAPCKRIARQQRSACALEAAQSALRFVRRWSTQLSKASLPS